MTKEAFRQQLAGFMRADRNEYMAKQAASPADIPPELLQQVQQPMPQPSPEEMAMMQAQQGMPPEAAGQDPAAQGQPAPQSEKLNIQAIGPEAIDAIKGMMGQQVAQAAAVPEGIKMASLNKKAAFRNVLAGFMAANRDNNLRKQAALEHARGNVLAMIKKAAGK